MALLNGSGAGLIAVGQPLLSVSAWQFSMEDIDYVTAKKGSESASGLVPLTSKYGADLYPKDFITWNVDYKQMGVGGDNSWRLPVHDEYTLPAKEYGYSFLLIPTDGGKGEPGELARKWQCVLNLQK